MVQNFERFTQEELDLIAETSGWPLEILTDPEKQPLVVEDLNELKNITFWEDFTDRCVVLPNGCNTLGLDDVIPLDLKQVIQHSGSVLDLLENFTEEMFDQYQGKICYIKEDGRDDEPDFDSMKSQLEYIKDCQHHERNLYLTEVRYKKKYRHPITNEFTKTACIKDAKDSLGEAADYGCLYWDRYDTGIFIGNSGSGMGLHSDQVFWSNFGKNWSGMKLLGLWEAGPTSVELLEEHRHCIFAKPPHGVLGEAEMRWVERVHVVCMLKPGDAMIFSAAGAHFAISICHDDHLATSAYESFINFHPAHVRLFLQTGEEAMHHRKFIMHSEDVYDIKDDMLDQIERVIERWELLPQTRRDQFVLCLQTLMENCRYFHRQIGKIFEEQNLLIADNQLIFMKQKSDSMEVEIPEFTEEQEMECERPLERNEEPTVPFEGTTTTTQPLQAGEQVSTPQEASSADCS